MTQSYETYKLSSNAFIRLGPYIFLLSMIVFIDIFQAAFVREDSKYSSTFNIHTLQCRFLTSEDGNAWFL